MNSPKQSQTNQDLLHPYSEAGFNGHQAPPLLIAGRHAKKKLVDSQDRIAREFALVARYELSEYVSPSIVNFVARSVIDRIQKREAYNYGEYTRRLHKTGFGFGRVPLSKTLEAYFASRNALYGRYNTVAQTDLARRALGMPMDYADITVIGDYRRHLLEPMWDEFSEFLGEDATPRSEQMDEESFEALGFDNDITIASLPVGAVRIGMKRSVPKPEENETIFKGRTLAIISPHQKSEFSEADARAIREAKLEGVKMKDVSEFHNAVRWLIDEKPTLAQGVLALNESIHGFSQATLDKVAEINGYTTDSRAG